MLAGVLALAVGLGAGACSDGDGGTGTTPDADAIDGAVTPDAGGETTGEDAAGSDTMDQGDDAGGDAPADGEPGEVTPTECKNDGDCEGALDLGPCRVAVCGENDTCVPEDAQDGISCDDQNPCTTSDRCSDGVCKGDAKQCNDDNPCTDDSCDAESGECVHEPNDAPCDDGSACTENDQCEGGECVGEPIEECECEIDEDCAKFDDDNPCNGELVCNDQGSCVVEEGSAITCDPSLAGPCEKVSCDPQSGECETTPLDDGTNCDDGNACTKNDACQAGTCKGEPISCDDDNPCTDDACDPEEGCTHEPNSMSCDDGDPCTVDDTCSEGSCTGEPNPECECSTDEDCADFEDGNLCNGTLTCDEGECVVEPGTPVDCSEQAEDAGPCEKVSCEPATGECVTEPKLDGSSCDDGNACTTDDSCQDGECLGEPVDCDDGNPCTEASCDPTEGCVQEQLTGPSCDDGDPCTTGDSCQEGTCTGEEDPSCQCESDADCEDQEDGNLCNGTLECSEGQCVVDPSTVVECDTEGLSPCVEATCDPDTGECTKTQLPDGESCDDQNACTKGDACSDGVCKGEPVSCDDNDVCTTDSCDPDVGCVHEFNDAPCDDGNACTENDKCQEGTCTGTQIPECSCTEDADCDEQEDGNPCNGTLICQSNKCVVDPDTVVSCEPAEDPCAVNQCNPETGSCELTPLADGKDCDDGDACTTGDTCEGGECVGSGSPDCDDGNPCTLDQCDPSVGCVHPPDEGASCDDGDPCTEGDSCGPDGTCQPGDPVDSAECTNNCSPAFSLGCGDTDSWGTDTAGATDEVESYGCTDTDFPGHEYAYTYTAPYDGTLTANLSNEQDLDGGPTELDVFILSSTGSGCTPANCEATGFASAQTEVTEGETYYVVVDNFVDEKATYELSLSCTPAAETACDDGVDNDEDGDTDCEDPDCEDAEPCQAPTCDPDWTLGCGDSDSWATTNAGTTDELDSYACNDFSYPAAEYTYEFQPSQSGQVTVTLSDETAETDIMVLEDSEGMCLAEQCITSGLQEATFEAQADQLYYLVVDGFNGDTGSYTISVTCGGADTETSCGDGMDNDDDGDTDCADPDCEGDAACSCSGDGDCSGDLVCEGGSCTKPAGGSESNCDDGVDNDDDGNTDCDDADCDGEPACQSSCTPDSSSAAKLGCPQGSDAWNNESGSPGVTDEVDSYGCNSADYSGPEYIYTYEAETSGTVTVSQGPNTESDDELDIFVLEDTGGGCDPTSCLEWSIDRTTFEAEAGTTYYIAVDGYQGTTGDYELALRCGEAPTTESACDDGEDNDLDFATDCDDDDCADAEACTGCDTDEDCADGETCHEGSCVECVDDTDCGGEASCEEGACVPISESNCTDGIDNDQDGKTDCLDGDCLGSDDACPACQPDSATPAQLSCPEDSDVWNNGDAGSTEEIEDWGCLNVTSLTGPEYIYTYEAESSGTVTVTQSSDVEGDDGLDVLVLEDEGLGCNPASCLQHGMEEVQFEAEAGTTYYVALDGYQGATVDYELAFQCGGSP